MFIFLCHVQIYAVFYYYFFNTWYSSFRYITMSLLSSTPFAPILFCSLYLFGEELIDPFIIFCYIYFAVIILLLSMNMIFRLPSKNTKKYLLEIINKTIKYHFIIFIYPFNFFLGYNLFVSFLLIIPVLLVLLWIVYDATKFYLKA
jgi:hypothetical protein